MEGRQLSAPPLDAKVASLIVKKIGAGDSVGSASVPTHIGGHGGPPYLSGRNK